MKTRLGLQVAGRNFQRWLHQPAPAERLAALRIAIGGFVVLYLVANAAEFGRLARRESRAFEAVGVARLLTEPLGSGAVWALFVALLVSGLAFTLGVGVRCFGPVFAVLVLFWTSYHSSWGQLLHFEHLFTIHLLILAGAPTADAWAIGRRQRASPSIRYGWPIRLLAIATVVTYVLAGIAKLRLSGLAWFDPDTLANHIGYSATRMEAIGGQAPPLARPVLQARWLLTPMAIATLMVELGAPVALMQDKLRNLWVAAALAFHASTAATMFVFFGYRGLGVGLLPLFRIDRFVNNVAAQLGSGPAR